MDIADQDTKLENGTLIKLSKLKRQSSFNLESIADNLSKIFIVDDNFKISLSDNDGNTSEVNNERRYNGFEKQFEWNVDSLIEDENEYKGKLSGHL